MDDRPTTTPASSDHAETPRLEGFESDLWEDLKIFGRKGLSDVPNKEKLVVLYKTTVHRVRNLVKVAASKKEIVIPFVDKLSFFWGVFLLTVSEYLICQTPRLLSFFYPMNLIPACIIRYFMYAPQKWQYFLLDFCYYANAFLIFHIFLYPASPLLFEICFMFANGPLLIAIALWKNSLVLHDIDKMTSVILHGFAPVVTYALRWKIPAAVGSRYFPLGVVAVPERMQLRTIWVALLMYLIWQLCYYLKVAEIDRKALERDPELQNSERWLASRLAEGTFLYKLYNLRGHSPRFQTLMFMLTQLAYTFGCLIPTYLLYRFRWLHATTLLVIGGTCVWNGAGYYQLWIANKRQAHEKKAAAAAAAAANISPATTPASPLITNDTGASGTSTAMPVAIQHEASPAEAVSPANHPKAQ